MGCVCCVVAALWSLCGASPSSRMAAAVRGAPVCAHTRELRVRAGVAPAHAASRRRWAPPRAQLNPAAQSGGAARSGDVFKPPAVLAAAAVADVATLRDAVVQPAPAPAVETHGFDWSRHWYALAALDALDPAVPTAVTVLGQRIAIWRDASGTWRALRDVCPHRLAPLSEGRVAEDGTLQCSYHAWRFDGAGACTCVPQKGGQGAARSPRAAARSFPTAQAQGLLWIFPCAAADAAQAAAAAALPLIPGLDGAPGLAAEERATPYVRDFPFGLETLLENLCDPAHVAYAHHGVAVRCARLLHGRLSRSHDAPRAQGNRERAGATPMRCVEPPSAAGFAALTPGDPGRHPAQLVRLRRRRVRRLAL